MYKELKLPGMIEATKEGFSGVGKSTKNNIQAKRAIIIRTIEDHLSGNREKKRTVMKMEEISEDKKIMKICLPYGRYSMNIFPTAGGENVGFAFFDLEEVTKKNVWLAISDKVSNGDYDKEIERISKIMSSYSHFSKNKSGSSRAV